MDAAFILAQFFGSETFWKGIERVTFLHSNPFNVVITINRIFHPP